MADEKLNAKMPLWGVLFPSCPKACCQIMLCHWGQSCLKSYWSAKNLQSPLLPRLNTPHLICPVVNCYNLVWQTHLKKWDWQQRDPTVGSCKISFCKILVLSQVLKFWNFKSRIKRTKKLRESSFIHGTREQRTLPDMFLHTSLR